MRRVNPSRGRIFPRGVEFLGLVYIRLDSSINHQVAIGGDYAREVAGKHLPLLRNKAKEEKDLRGPGVPV